MKVDSGSARPGIGLATCLRHTNGPAGLSSPECPGAGSGESTHSSRERPDAMANYQIGDIRNIALAGHGASGKTSLADALLFTAGATDRRGSVDDGTSLSDVEDE